MLTITSLHNPRIKTLTALRDRRQRDRAGLMLVEGFEEIGLALDSGAVVEVYTCAALWRDPAQRALLDRAAAAGAALIAVSAAVFEKIAYRENPDGWLATFRSPAYTLADLRLSPNPFVVVVESVEKPGNLGAMLRTADAAGVDALIACDPATDWGNPNVVRASKGALFAVPVAAAASADTLDWLREQRLRLVVTTPAAERPYTREDLTGPVAIAIGEEKHGLSRLWLDAAAVRVSIPMFGRVNSLNAAAAAALLMYEVVRQRRA